MALTPNFSVTQTPGSPSIVSIADDSTGSYGAVTQRRVYLAKYDGTFLVPEGTGTEYVEWALADTSIDIDALDKDYSLVLTTQWLDVSNNILYAKSSLYGLTGYGEDFDYSMTQMLAVNPNNVNDSDFFVNKLLLRNYLDSGDNAISRASDQYAAQLCYDQATTLRTGSPYYFNSNA